ncbi:MAG: 23S rRNA (guanosine(2251)-2'-O)-methyltransferase RlmB [Oscillospiraceae bacterium]|jgi:23S rRNA (guanosine2251-2'-O)-methyltransferase|nr:23S rRNA (guanosine(2251)-2'-O)-methyltransferase RlmB [Oscillospiraceae bacterium]
MAFRNDRKPPRYPRAPQGARSSEQRTSEPRTSHTRSPGEFERGADGFNPNRTTRYPSQGGGANRTQSGGGAKWYDRSKRKPSAAGDSADYGARQFGNDGGRPYGDRSYSRDQQSRGQKFGAQPFRRFDDKGRAQTGDRPYDKPNAQRGDRTGFAPTGDRPFQKPYAERGSRHGFAPTGDRPFQKPYGERGDRAGFAPTGDRPGFAQPGDRPIRKPYGERDARSGFSQHKNYNDIKNVPYDRAPQPPRDREYPARKSDRPRREAFVSAEARGDASALAIENTDSRAADNILAGRNPIREALRAGRDLEKLMVARGDLSGSAREIISIARERHIPIQEVDRVVLDSLSAAHQGLIAYASAYRYAVLDDIFSRSAERGEEPFVIILDGITDPHNLGAIIRTAECAGAHGVIVPERRAVGLTTAAVKASAGAVEHIPVVRVTNISKLIDALKERGLWIAAGVTSGEPFDQADITGPIALLIGGEGEGVSRLAMEHCDRKVALPLFGKTESLNASVAAGVLMYEVVRRRRGADGAARNPSEGGGV